MSYAMLVDPRAEGGGAPWLSLPAGTALNDAAEVLRRWLNEEERPDRLLLVVGDERIGATSSTYLRIVLEMQPARGPGDEVRAAAPGESTRFRVIAFRCAQCGSCAYTAFYDDRYRPVCRAGDHGPMELR
ncbi:MULTISPECIES: hypothetical protein [unclassified Streptomyces]|uniref:hypothetical protein n=1 Tax=unclassified Streptomyces TaxID=2593676 RepID=UPI000708B1C6|nr:hypothetical protein [Streptomyces sp. Root1310]KQX65029.1 hypothetical protein ASD48_18185 [Streptomyces sp. Root1310]